MVGRPPRLVRALLDGVPVGLEEDRGHEVDGHGHPAPFRRHLERRGTRGDARHPDRRMRLLVGANMRAQPDVGLGRGHGEAIAVALVDAGRRIGPERQDRVQGGARIALIVDRGVVAPIAEDPHVAGEAARADPPVEAALRHVIELRDAVGEDEGIVVRDAAYARAEPDPLRERDRLGDEQVRRGDVLPLRGEVLADPGLGIAERVERDDLIQVRLERLGEVRTRRVQRHGEEAELHRAVSSGGCPQVRPA